MTVHVVYYCSCSAQTKQFGIKPNSSVHPLLASLQTSFGFIRHTFIPPPRREKGMCDKLTPKDICGEAIHPHTVSLNSCSSSCGVEVLCQQKVSEQTLSMT